MNWSISDIEFDLYSDMTDGPVISLVISTPLGTIYVITEPEVTAPGVLVLRGTHISGLAANELGISRLRSIMDAALTKGDYDEIIIEGGVRTTGANPGHIPRTLRFPRSR